MKNRIIFMVQVILNLILLLALIVTGIAGISSRNIRIMPKVTLLSYGAAVKAEDTGETAESDEETVEEIMEEAAKETVEEAVEEKDTDTEATDSHEEGNAMVDAVKYRYPYAVVSGRFDDAIAAYTDVETELIVYQTTVLLVSMPEDGQKEERINRMMVERYLQYLPPITEESWWKMARPQITYRSERYLCFYYMPSPYILEESDYGKLFFTLDLERECWVEYPFILTVHGEEQFVTRPYGRLYAEMAEYREKTVEEQDSLRNETNYQIYEREAEYEGITFSCIAIDGMENQEKQEHINELLQEPLQSLISCPEWKEEEKEERNRVFQDVKTYLAYKSEKWLSVVYSVKLRDIRNYNEDDDGMAKIGITIDMESGERVMLDDLFEIQKLLDWMYAVSIYDEADRYYKITLGSVMTEKEILNWYQEKYGHASDGYRALDAYNNGLIDSFYLYEGKLVILSNREPWDVEIPLPEVYEYLKVDPWYD